MRILRSVILSTLLAAVSCSVWAVDGTVLISQASVLASGGFPYTISQPGSYRLSGNLVSSAGSNGIFIASSNVTLDLNGFSITGSNQPGDSYVGSGIRAGAVGYSNVEVFNGAVQGYTIGVSLQFCTACIVRQIRVSNSSNGIWTGAGAIVTGNSISSPVGAVTPFAGIDVGSGSIVSGNAISASSYGIIAQSQSVLSGNVVRLATTVAIQVDCPVNVVGNYANVSSFNVVFASTSTGCTLFNNSFTAGP